MRDSRTAIKRALRKAFARSMVFSVMWAEAFCPSELSDRSICIDGDIGEVLRELSAPGK